MNLIEIKLVLDWAKNNLEMDKGARISNPEKFEETSKIYQKVKDKFNEECVKWFNKNIK